MEHNNHVWDTRQLLADFNEPSKELNLIYAKEVRFLEVLNENAEYFDGGSLEGRRLAGVPVLLRRPQALQAQRPVVP